MTIEITYVFKRKNGEYGACVNMYGITGSVNNGSYVQSIEEINTLVKKGIKETEAYYKTDDVRVDEIRIK